MFGRLPAFLIGAVAIAIALGYYNHKFSQYKFIDFNEFIGYTNNDIFKPNSNNYLIIIYNSRDIESIKKLNNLNIKSSTQVIAIDYFQSLQNLNIGEANLSQIKFGTETFLKLVNRFHIYNLPSIFSIELIKNSRYKQNSEIYTFETFTKNKI
jgi:hypothetical protein